MVDYFSSASGQDASEAKYIRISGTSSDEIWPIMLQKVKELFGDSFKG
jgi:hypothetical protein